MKWSYEILGKGRNNVEWKVTGQMEALPGHFPLVVQDALKESFERLTEGRAEYGDQTTCQGPYRIERLLVELVDEDFQAVADFAAKQMAETIRQDREKK